MPILQASKWLRAPAIACGSDVSQSEGGALKNIFNDRWYKLLEEGGDDLSERDVFESLLEIVNENADESYEWAFEGGPGMSSDYSFYFVESAESAEKAAQELMKT